MYNPYMRWVHEYEDWTQFTWDTDVINPLLKSCYIKREALFDKMESIGFDVHREASLKTLTEDILKSSAIESEILNLAEVRSSLARRLGLRYDASVSVGREVDGFAQMMIDAIWKYAKPLTKTRLCDWHSALFPSGKSGMYTITVGDWRTEQAGPMQVVSGAIGYEKVHFEAPHAHRLESEMTLFLDWFNREDDCDPLVKAAVSHFWFVTLHPFEDGNGRIGRAVCDMALAKADKNPERYYSLSAQFEAERNDYYKQLEAQQRGTSNVTPWIEWFLSCYCRALVSSEKRLQSVFQTSAVWKKLDTETINERQRLVINRMLQDDFVGFINSSKYAKLAKCSTDTALRDMQDLKARGALLQNTAGGRSTSYRLVD